METGGGSSFVKETVITCVEAPRLKGVSTRQFIEFRRLRELYEKQIEEKSKQLKEDLIPTSYRASIENDDLKIFIAAGWIDCASIEELTERQIQQCVAERCKQEITGEQLYLVDAAVRNVSMQMNIFEAEDRIWSLRREYVISLRKAGFEDIIEDKPHIAIDHILKKLKPPQLYHRMLDIIKWRKNEDFHKKDFDRFIREIALQAKKIQTEQKTMPPFDHRSAKEANQTPKSTYHAIRNRHHFNERMVTAQRQQTERGDSDKIGKKRKRDVFEAPLCLNPKCREQGRRHYLSKCEFTDKKTRDTLLDEYRNNKKARLNEPNKNAGKVGRLTSVASPTHSSIFKASFAKGTIKVDLLADQGADANFISRQVFERIKEHQSHITEDMANARQVYRDVTGNPCLTCQCSVKLDVFLQIRHGTSLILRNVTWKVVKEDIQTPIIGRRVLESLGCDNRKMLLAARDKFGDNIDVVERLIEDGNEEETDSTIAALYGDALFHQGVVIDDDGLHEEDAYIDLGDDPPQTVQKELQNRIDEARLNGLSDEGVKTLSTIIDKHSSIFKIRLGSGGPAKVTPMKINLDKSRKPVKVKVRKYPSDQRKFLDAYFNELVGMGFLKTCPQAEWQAAPHLVPKDSKSKYRTTIDLRPVNAATKSEQWPMPQIEAELCDFVGSKHFASLDFCSSYWQCPLDPSSYQACGIIAPQGTYVSTRVLHGLKNASAYFQSTIPPLFDKMKHVMKAWIDDFILYTHTEMELLQYLDEFFMICGINNLRLSATKSVFYTKKVKWCGRIIDENGYQLDPRNIEALQTMETPITASELCQIIHCCRWMSNCIPDFHRKVKPLDEILEKAYAKAGKRKKSALKNIALHTLSWGTEHSTALALIQDSLRNAVKLAFHKEDKVVCIYTDASEALWASVVTQIEEDELDKPMEQQRHEPLAFLGGKFTGAQINWTTYEKEAYAIVQTFDRLDYILCGAKQTHVFTDHRNLLFIFAPLALRPNSPRHVLSKVHRWAINLSRFQFHINHIEGVNNTFADLLTRWSKGYRTIKARAESIAALYQDIVPESTSTSTTSIEDIKQEQAKYPTIEGTTRDEEGVMRHKDKIAIPHEADRLKLRIIVEAHCGTRGHRAYKPTLSVIAEQYWWNGMRDDIREFTQACIHCIVSRNGERIPRPLSTALHGERPNEVVHADFLYMGPAEESDVKYILIIKDDLSSYTWLHPCISADSDAAVRALSRWISCFGVMEWLVTDQGSHFKASLMEGLTSEMRVNHHFTTAYCPWANGTIERLCREVLRITRSLLSEWKLSVGQWPTMIDSLQKIMNQSPAEHLGKGDHGNTLCPMEVFCGLKPSALLIRPTPFRRFRDMKAIKEERCKQIININRMHTILSQMHKSVSAGKQRRRSYGQMLHNAKTHVLPVNIEVGDYVMVRTHATKMHKLQSRWRGPMRVTKAKSHLVFEVENVNDGSKSVVHAQRIVPYPATRRGEQASMELKEQAKHYDTQYHLVDSIRGVRKRDGEYEVLVKWLGFAEGEDETWEALGTMKEDLPGVMEDFLYSAGDRNIKREILDLY